MSATILGCLRMVFHHSSFQNWAGKRFVIFEENLRSGDFSLFLSLHGRQRKEVLNYTMNEIAASEPSQ